MCGRFVLQQSPHQVAMRFNAAETLGEAQARYNIAPTQPVVAVLTNGSRHLEELQWGLIPSWAKAPSIGSKMINARAETLLEKPSFNRLVTRRRCVIPASGFYEWKHEGSGKQPMFIHLKDNALFGFAGLWDEWQSPDGSPLRTCTIITTTPNDLMADIHDRMPAILKREDEAAWLDMSIKSAPVILSLLHPYKAAAMEAYPVSRRVNTPTVDDPELVTPVAMS